MTQRTSTRQIDILRFRYLRATAVRLLPVRSSKPPSQERFRRIWSAKATTLVLLGSQPNEKPRLHLIVRKWHRYSRGRRSPVSFRGECSRQQMRRLPVISSPRRLQVLSLTSAETSLVRPLPLGLVHMDLPPLASPSRWRTKMRGM